jgi:putative peptidoglycan lipid II flippase
LNALGHFFIPALAPAMLSVTTIVYVVCIKQWALDPMQGLAISTTVGGALHLAMVWPLLRREGMAPRWKWNPGHPDIRRVTLLIVPALWGLSIDQVNAYVDTICASFLQEGSVTALYNSNRLMQFALALFGVSISTATLPHLSMSAAREEWGAFKENLNFSLRMTLYLVIPAMVGLIVLARPLVKTLVSARALHRASDAHDRVRPGRLHFGFARLCVGEGGGDGFLCTERHQNSRSRWPRSAWIINMAGNVLLMGRWGVGGLAFATAFASFVNGVILLWVLRREMGMLGGRKILRTVVGSGVASALMASGSLGDAPLGTRSAGPPSGGRGRRRDSAISLLLLGGADGRIRLFARHLLRRAERRGEPPE